MCGRFFRHTPREELAAAFRADPGIAASEAGYNIAPGQPIVTVRFNPHTGRRTLDDLSWGLVAHFEKDRNVAWKTINARAETLDKARPFRAAFKKRRCLVVVDGFFEWRAFGKAKQPYAVALPSEKPFALAGVWEGWQDPATGEWLRSCSIVTTESNPDLRAIHHRMPAIIEEADYARWLGEEPAGIEELKALLRPYPSPLKVWPVSPHLNRPGLVEGPAALDPVADPAAATDEADRASKK